MINVNNGNCSEVRGAELLLGIPTKASEAFVGALPLKYESTSDRIHFAQVRFSAQFVKRKIIECTPQKAWSNVFIVYVEIWKLNFGGLPYLQGLDVWPGGEGKREQFFWGSSRDKPDHRNFNHAQIWTIKRDDEVYLCDRYGGIRILKHDVSGNLSLAVPSPAEVAQFFRKNTQQGVSEKRRAWALRNLKVLLDKYPDAEGKS